MRIDVALRLQSHNDCDTACNQSGSEVFNGSNDNYPNFNISVSLEPSLEDCINKTSDKNAKENEPNELFSNISDETNNKTEGKSLTVKNNVCDNEETFFLLPNEFDVLLYVDNKELEDKQNIENDKIVRYLKKRNVKFEIKCLNIGDYLWVCRDLKTNNELVLPYIIERKRLDDLASSIKDGRFHEQKFRLKNSGIENCIYLVEKYGNESTRLGLPLPTIQQAVSNTRVVDGFHIKITNNNLDSLVYLTLMTNFLKKIFKDKTLMSCNRKCLPPFNMSDDIISLMPFKEFNKDSEKMRKFTVRNMLVKHLLQLHGLSVEKAKALVKFYPTPKSLMEALNSSCGAAALTNITSGALNRSIGSTLAKSIYDLYTLPKLN